MTQEEIKAEVQRQYEIMGEANKRLEYLRTECKHPNTKLGLYSWRIGSTMEKFICTDCDKPLDFNDIKTMKRKTLPVREGVYLHLIALPSDVTDISINDKGGLSFKQYMKSGDVWNTEMLAPEEIGLRLDGITFRIIGLAYELKDAQWAYFNIKGMFPFETDKEQAFYVLKDLGLDPQNTLVIKEDNSLLGVMSNILSTLPLNSDIETNGISDGNIFPSEDDTLLSS